MAGCCSGVLQKMQLGCCFSRQALQEKKAEAREPPKGREVDLWQLGAGAGELLRVRLPLPSPASFFSAFLAEDAPYTMLQAATLPIYDFHPTDNGALDPWKDGSRAMYLTTYPGIFATAAGAFLRMEYEQHYQYLNASEKGDQLQFDSLIRCTKSYAVPYGRAFDMRLLWNVTAVTNQEIEVVVHGEILFPHGTPLAAPIIRARATAEQAYGLQCWLRGATASLNARSECTGRGEIPVIAPTLDGSQQRLFVSGSPRAPTKSMVFKVLVLMSILWTMIISIMAVDYTSKYGSASLTFGKAILCYGGYFSTSLC